MFNPFSALVIKGIRFCLAAWAAILPLESGAASGIVKGQVEFVRTHDAAQMPEWTPPQFWFSLKGSPPAGNCQKWVNGAALFVMNDKQALSIILAAQASGQEIAVAFDDTRVLHGLCAPKYITIGNPAPPY